MRGSYTGALEMTYLHSPITESLWCDVAEAENMFTAKLAHAMMLAALYGNSSAKLESGNDQVHEMYVNALKTMPYIHVGGKDDSSEIDALVKEWERMNAVKEGDGKGDSDV